MTDSDSQFMALALHEARKAEAAGEVPVGAVLVRDGEVLARGWNRNIMDNDPTAHAEIVALREAAGLCGNHRLPGTTLYVTLEPCCMCAGAMIHARIERLVFAAEDPKTGAAGGCFDVLSDARHNHRITVESGCMEVESSELLRQFFRARR